MNHTLTSQQWNQLVTLVVGAYRLVDSWDAQGSDMIVDIAVEDDVVMLGIYVADTIRELGLEQAIDAYAQLRVVEKRT